MKNLTQIVEAILFASGDSKKKADILSLLPDVSNKEFEIALSEIKEKYSGDSGVLFLEFNNKIQFSTNPIYGDIVSEVLTPLKEKELSKVLLEVLAIIAYKQPITRMEIEKIKSTSADYAMGILIKTGLIEAVGRKDAVGRPVTYGTTDEFLKKFQLHNLSELPDYEAVLEKLEEMGEFHKSQSGLYRDIELNDDFDINTASDEEIELREKRLNEIDKSLDEASIIDEILSEDELPDFLEGEEFQVID